MRLFYLIICLLLPQFAFAQIFGFIPFESGSYVAASSPTTRVEAGLKLRNGELLIAKDGKGKKSEFSPQQIISFRVGDRKYTTATGFETRNGLFSASTTRVKFVELLDSGQVILMRYTYYASNGSGPYGGGGTQVEEYLLRRSIQSAITPIEANWLGGGKHFMETLLPYLSARPDLIKALVAKEIVVDDLAPLIHALNTNQPFVRPKPTGPFGVH
ncbi:hypothetical protein [Hymenobacter baengnokdamensis]|uniref:hypothetical protein n=1 Tax=Hymenobacter baengnokdamensis TaxID=2615203 RepID=UPI0012492307|nr:hypothetical protein [Hymenobacter baengnokdamensis]